MRLAIMEAILYQFTKLSGIIVIYLIGVMVVGAIVYFLVNEFKEKDSQFKLYGLFLQMKNIDIILLALAMGQLVITSYAAIFKQSDVIINSVTLAIISFLFILYRFRNIIFEIINLVVQVIAIYLNQTLYQYSIEVDQNITIKTIQITLNIVMILYAIYAFLTHLETIVKKNKNVRRNTSEKE